MISYRTFRNGDPPDLARIWNRQPPLDERLGEMTSLLVDEYVLSRPYFDRAGLWLALDDLRPIGFVHAGFAPTDDGARIDRRRGAVLTLMVEPREDASAVASRLLERAETYLRSQGAEQIFGGSPVALTPFYWGLAGGCGAIGVSDGDELLQRTLQAAGYQAQSRHRLLRRALPGFRPNWDRLYARWKRQAKVVVAHDDSTANWWEAATLTFNERLRVDVFEAPGAAPRATMRFWDLRPMSDISGVHGQGLFGLQCDDEAWNDGLVRFAWSETLETFQRQRQACVLAAAPVDDARLGPLLEQLGFREAAGSTLWMRPADGAA